MLKIRIQGTINDIKWFERLLLRSKELNIISFSEPYSNVGTKKYFRVYIDVERNKD